MIIPIGENVNMAEIEMVIDEVEIQLLGKIITTKYASIFELRLGGMF